MTTNNLILFIQVVSPIFGLLAILYKLYAIRILKQKHKLRIAARLLSFYKNESIYCTPSTKKRAYMTISNYLTLIIYLCVLPDMVLICLHLGEKCTLLLDSILQ